MGTIGEAVRRRRSGLRAGVAGRILDFALIAIIAAFLILLGTKVAAQGGSFFIQILTFAIANGGIYALIALGYTMVYGIIELINFAHGDVFAFGAFLSASLLPIFGLREGGAFTAGSVIAHDPGLDAVSNLWNLSETLNLTPITVLAIQVAIAAIAMGAAILVRAKGRRAK